MGTILTMCLFFGLTFNMIFLEFCAPPGTTLPGLLSVPKAKATWLNKKKKEKRRRTRTRTRRGEYVFMHKVYVYFPAAMHV
jgi:hypothetical protein